MVYSRPMKPISHDRHRGRKHIFTSRWQQAKLENRGQDKPRTSNPCPSPFSMPTPTLPPILVPALSDEMFASAGATCLSLNSPLLLQQLLQLLHCCATIISLYLTRCHHPLNTSCRKGANTTAASDRGPMNKNRDRTCKNTVAPAFCVSRMETGGKKEGKSAPCCVNPSKHFGMRQCKKKYLQMRE